MEKKIVLGVDNGRTDFELWQADDGIYAIQWPGFLPGPGRLPGWGYVISYVVIGEEKALLLDTGFGNADIKAFVEENITTLPLVVVNSHIHPDHSGGNGQFDVVYVEEHEKEDEEGVYFYKIPGMRAACEAVVAGGEYRFAHLKDGDVIDLGGRELEVIWIPGHTPGAIALYDRKTQILLSGDAILKRVFYGSGVPFSQYRAALVKTKGYPIRDIWSAHWPEPLGTDFIDKMIYLIDTFDPEKAEPAGWDEPGMEEVDLRMFCYGEDFDDPDFVAVSFNMDQLEKIMK